MLGCVQVQAATWALDRGVSVVICNGMQDHAIETILEGRKIGTFFTESSSTGSTPIEFLAENGKLMWDPTWEKTIGKIMGRLHYTRRLFKGMRILFASYDNWLFICSKKHYTLSVELSVGPFLQLHSLGLIVNVQNRQKLRILLPKFMLDYKLLLNVKGKKKSHAI